jgi:hypothetical protein
MAVNKPRNRILIFRLTQDEYDALQSASSGMRSLSDYARTKLLGSLGASRIDEQLTEIKTTVARLADLLEKS